MYKAKLKQGKRILDYLQTSSLAEVKDRFNGRHLQPNESFELLWFVELVYHCSAGDTIHLYDSKEAFLESEPTAPPEIDPNIET